MIVQPEIHEAVKSHVRIENGVIVGESVIGFNIHNFFVDGPMDGFEWPYDERGNYKYGTDEAHIDAYGTADSVDQILAYFKPLIDDPNVEIAITAGIVRKADQEERGGWRWHKWGSYIGTHEITTEYLYDEPIVETVYCFHGYMKRAEK